MVRQIVVAILALSFLIFSIFWAFKIGQPKPIAKKANYLQTARLVETSIAQNKTMQTKVQIYGRLVPYEKTEIFSELGGMLKSMGKEFKEGVRFLEGDLILSIDDSEQQLNLRAQRAALLTSITQILPDIKINFQDNLDSWLQYQKSFDLDKNTQPIPKATTDREKNFIALKNIYNQYYNIKSIEEKLKKFKIYAPFSGELTEAFISTGSLIRAGQKIGTLMNTSIYELQASVPVKDLNFIKVGASVSLKSEDSDGSWNGRISRISGSIESKTQTVKVFVQVTGANLRENMFMTGEINANTIANVIELPRKLLVDDSKIFTVISDSILALIPVQISKKSEKSATIRGIPDGTVILMENFPGAYEGLKVKTKK